MKIHGDFRFLAVMLLITGMLLPVYGQSGRRRRVEPPPSSPSSAPNTPAPADRSQPAADKPLEDTSPVEVSDDGTIKLDTTMVTIPVSVTDRDGKFIPNLGKREFHIYEDGIEQDIESFESVEVPFHVVLLLDTSNSTRFRLEDIQAAATSFVGQLRWDDQVMVISFNDRVTMECDFTSDRGLLRRAIYQSQLGGSTKLYEAVDIALVDALSRVKGRKAIVLFTDGVDTTSRRATALSTLELVEESDVLVYPVRYDTEMDNSSGGGVILGNPRGLPQIGIPWPLPRNPRRPNRRWPLVDFQLTGQWPQQGRFPMPGGGRDDYSRAAQYLQEMADRSGGRLYYADSLQNLSYAFSQIAEELRHQYALSYYPKNSEHDGSYRQIRVRINRAGTVVRARKGYRAVGGTRADGENPQEQRRRPELRRRSLAQN